MATPGKKGKKDGKRQMPAKTSFTSPFSPQWSPLPQEDMHFILNILKKKVISTGLEKKEVKVFRPWRKKKGQTPSDPVPEVSQDTCKDPESSRGGWTDVGARKQLAIGINEVTKALERNELKLVLVCKSVKPKHMTDHLITLTATRGVPACQVPQLSRSLSEPLGLKSVLALGFRRCDCRDDEVFADTVEAITPRVPSLDVTWLQGVTLKRPADLEQEVVCEAKGQKRKLENKSEVTETDATSCTLMPLKVKRVVANPAKKRKVKS
ncbi:ribonuclease P protein subunit p38 [Aulostomus maculatus]